MDVRRCGVQWLDTVKTPEYSEIMFQTMFDYCKGRCLKMNKTKELIIETTIKMIQSASSDPAQITI
ncbi:hypothetical protein ACTQ6A_03705 [Lachnospiraceae bacterium LCP25S3_G4]